MIHPMLDGCRRERGRGEVREIHQEALKHIRDDRALDSLDVPVLLGEPGSVANVSAFTSRLFLTSTSRLLAHRKSAPNNGRWSTTPSLYVQSRRREDANLRACVA
ncbi:hypothetical protein AAFF_G00373960 [Aldrovandia affinis]|uniref:Uncharacterized protein n=1 Tax=Aldrovandia affinis TaxID=143900 RepID=A0AAD7R4E9_9TELE|nr:hypothetical protein AAFF_G00373960 [Aldrovandia affinis]